MILIADSGSSKTDWRLIDGETISQFETIGLNPFVVSSKVIDETVRQLDLDFSSINKVFFYGAGCGNTEKANALKMVLKNYKKNMTLLWLVQATLVVSLRLPLQI